MTVCDSVHGPRAKREHWHEQEHGTSIKHVCIQAERSEATALVQQSLEAMFVCSSFVMFDEQLFIVVHRLLVGSSHRRALWWTVR